MINLSTLCTFHLSVHQGQSSLGGGNITIRRRVTASISGHTSLRPEINDADLSDVRLEAVCREVQQVLICETAR